MVSHAFGQDYVEIEEHKYSQALDQKIKALNSDRKLPVEVLEEVDKTIFYEINTYGGSFGSESIKNTLSYYFVLIKRGEAHSKLDELLIANLKNWGRRTALTVACIYGSLSKSDQQIADELCRDIEGNRWDIFIKDNTYLKVARFWNDLGMPKNKVLKEVDENSITLERITMTATSMHEIKLEGDRIIRFQAGRFESETVKLAKVAGGIYTGIFQENLNNVEWDSQVIENRGRGVESIAWKDGEEGGILQIIRGNIVNDNRELYLFKIKGFGKPNLGRIIAKLPQVDLQIISTMGRYALDAVCEPVIDYLDVNKLCRYYRHRINPASIINIIKMQNGELGVLESYVIIYSCILPSMQSSDDITYDKYKKLMKQYQVHK